MDRCEKFSLDWESGVNNQKQYRRGFCLQQDLVFSFTHVFQSQAQEYHSTESRNSMDLWLQWVEEASHQYKELLRHMWYHATYACRRVWGQGRLTLSPDQLDNRIHKSGLGKLP